jgi:hypothetical protein
MGEMVKRLSEEEGRLWIQALATKGTNHWMMKITMIALKGADGN